MNERPQPEPLTVFVPGTYAYWINEVADGSTKSWKIRRYRIEGTDTWNIKVTDIDAPGEPLMYFSRDHRGLYARRDDAIRAHKLALYRRLSQLIRELADVEDQINRFRNVARSLPAPPDMVRVTEPKPPTSTPDPKPPISPPSPGPSNGTPKPESATEPVWVQDPAAWAWKSRIGQICSHLLSRSGELDGPRDDDAWKTVLSSRTDLTNAERTAIEARREQHLQAPKDADIATRRLGVRRRSPAARCETAGQGQKRRVIRSTRGLGG
jgi:hypothetical protein